MTMPSIHRSKTKVPMQDREHLHDGLRFMTADVAKTYGWHLPRSATLGITNEADVYEDKLYKAHDYAYRCGKQLGRIKIDMEKEYQKSGVPNGQTWDEFVEKSKSVMALVYREKQELLGRAVDKLGEVLRDCEAEEAKGKQDVEALEDGYGLRGMHCRCVEAFEYDDLDVRIKTEVPKKEHWRVALPFTTTDEMIHHRASKLPGPLQQGGMLMEMVEHGVDSFVALSCEVDVVMVSTCMTLRPRPCLPARVAEKGMREGNCLRVVMLADNNLGYRGLGKLILGLQDGSKLEALHYIDNGAGELPHSAAGVPNSEAMVESLAVIQRLGGLLKWKACPLRILNLSGNGIGPAGVSRICTGLACAQVLEVLDLSDNDLGVAGANHVAKALATNQHLKTLNLNRTQIRHPGLRSVCSALAYNRCLEVLHAQENLGASGPETVIRLLESNTTLKFAYVMESTPWKNPNYVAPKAAKPKTRVAPEGPKTIERKRELSRKMSMIDFGDDSGEEEGEPSDGEGGAEAAHDVGAEGGGRQGGGAVSRAELVMGEYSMVEPESSGSRVQGGTASWEPSSEFDDWMEDSEDGSDFDDDDEAAARGGKTRPAGVSVLPCWKIIPEMGYTCEFSKGDDGERDGWSSPLERTGVRIKELNEDETAAKLEELHRRIEHARENVIGISNVRADERIAAQSQPAREHYQGYGPELELGKNMPTAKQIVGLKPPEPLGEGDRGVDKDHVKCSWCLQAEKPAGCGPKGHEAWECPKRFHETFGLSMPGFTSGGFKVEDAFDGAQLDMIQETAQEWLDMRKNGFFTETGYPEPQAMRKVHLDDRNSQGKIRSLWSQAGTWNTPDLRQRRARFARFRDPAYDNFDENASAASRSRTSSRHERPSRSRSSRSGRKSYTGLKHIVDGHAVSAMSAVDVAGFIPSKKMRVALFLQKVRNNHLQEARSFLLGERGPCSPDEADEHGSTAIIIAAQNGYKRMTKLLIKAKCNLNHDNQRGNTALHYAHEYQYHALVGYLKEKGADDRMVNSMGYTCYEGLA